MSGPPYNVLFLCTGNSARSILAEALLNRDGAGAHRGIEDPAKIEGVFLNLPLENLDRMSLQHELKEIGAARDARTDA